MVQVITDPTEAVAKLTRCGHVIVGTEQVAAEVVAALDGPCQTVPLTADDCLAWTGDVVHKVLIETYAFQNVRRASEDPDADEFDPWLDEGSAA